ncbi:GNAT family N-acetyltransferase [uncultured Roseobacter sp.]|uniref:GNAT family N-acetyltransferase n=1 Tax=uncultured Roseobacter sp. TaxID=114847 RepID=UPI0026198272|nr:GNAT family N-acetyltransferase [uncultured Roseobacter sp.]
MTSPVADTPVLETTRLILRMPCAADTALYAAFFDAQTGDGYFYGGPLRPDQASVRLAADIGHWHMKGFGKFVMVDRETDAPIGGCGIVHWDGWPSHELTWWLLGTARGKGFATEAARAVLVYARDTLGWTVVETHVRDTNAAALRLVDRLGGMKLRRDSFPDGHSRDVFGFELAQQGEVA